MDSMWLIEGVNIAIRPQEAVEAVMPALRALERWTYLDLAGNHCNDDMLEHIASLSNTRELYLDQCDVTDSGEDRICA